MVNTVFYEARTIESGREAKIAEIVKDMEYRARQGSLNSRQSGQKDTPMLYGLKIIFKND